MTLVRRDYRSRHDRPSSHQSSGRTRSRSPRRHEMSVPITLPFNAEPLTKHELTTYRPLFALYLDIQKHLEIEDLDEGEVKGRWKSFIRKWNRGELAEGWYEPKTLKKAVISVTDKTPAQSKAADDHVAEIDEDEEFGPALPSSASNSDRNPQLGNSKHGPAIPTLGDIRARQEQYEEDEAQARQQHYDEVKTDRKAERKLGKERMEELVPRAQAGTRERQLEKKKEKAESNKGFAASKDGGEAELHDSEVFGPEDGIADLKRMQKENERKKTEREIRREENLMARKAEREVRLAHLRAKEAKTMDMLKEIAKARFGDD